MKKSILFLSIICASARTRQNQSVKAFQDLGYRQTKNDGKKN